MAKRTRHKVLNHQHHDSLQLHQWKFRSDIRSKFFTGKVVKHWSKLPREVVMAPSLSMFKKRLDNALRYMV